MPLPSDPQGKCEWSPSPKLEYRLVKDKSHCMCCTNTHAIATNQYSPPFEQWTLTPSILFYSISFSSKALRVGEMA